MLGHQVGKAGTVMSLAVGDHFLVFADAELFEDLGHVLADAQGIVHVHAGGPLEIDCAGNVPALGSQDFLAPVLSRAARVPDRQVGGAEAALQVFAGGRWLFVQGQVERAAGIGRYFSAEGARRPRLSATVEVVVTAMTDDIQQPDEAPGPAAAFVVIDHVDRIGVMAELGKQFFQVGLGRQQARRWRLAQLRALRVDEACTGNMPAGVAVNAGQVDQDQLWRIQPGLQVSRLDYQGQARKVSHPESPERNRGGDCSAWLRRCGC
ncbi:hypothetical protein D3C81_825320 [compost metagenome]